MVFGVTRTATTALRWLERSPIPSAGPATAMPSMATRPTMLTMYCTLPLPGIALFPEPMVPSGAPIPSPTLNAPWNPWAPNLLDVLAVAVVVIPVTRLLLARGKVIAWEPSARRRMIAMVTLLASQISALPRLSWLEKASQLFPGATAASKFVVALSCVINSFFESLVCISMSTKFIFCIVSTSTSKSAIMLILLH